VARRQTNGAVRGEYVMRKLLYVPVIHVESDMGSIGPDIDKRSADICGRERWEKHKKTVNSFWASIEEYFKGMDAGNLKIYQDGMPADGELGRRIVEEGARRGSRNFHIVLDLMERGGEIRKTEDVGLLKEEYNHILKLAQTKSLWERTTAYAGYRMHKDRIMEGRDQFVAETIDKTLKEEERGVLFMGAFHNVLQYLAGDIDVKEVKNIEKVRTYFTELISGKNEGKFNQLTKYLIAEAGISE